MKRELLVFLIRSLTTLLVLLFIQDHSHYFLVSVPHHSQVTFTVQLAPNDHHQPLLRLTIPIESQNHHSPVSSARFVHMRLALFLSPSSRSHSRAQPVAP